MRRSLAIVLALTGASFVWAQEQNSDAPLSETKEQLQALRRDESAQRTATPGGLKLDIPSINAPDLGSDLNLSKPKKDEDSDLKKNAKRKNWLLDGYDKLDRKKSGVLDTAGKKGDQAETDPEEKLDPKDPDYFLHVYEKQRAESDAKQLELKNAAAAQTADQKMGGMDPFAPFMREWLANSPVRDVIRDSNAASAATGAGDSNAATVSSDVNTTATTNTSISEGSRAAAGNPFLQALGLPSSSGQPSDAHPRVVEPSAASVFNVPAPTPLPLQVERPRDEQRNAVPPPPTDKKYFPQLKKF